MKRLFVACACLMLSSPAALAYSSAEKNAFLKADQDGSHTIDSNEIVVLINELAATGSGQAKRVKFLGIYGMAFRTIDANGDGKITPAELEVQR